MPKEKLKIEDSDRLTFIIDAILATANLGWLNADPDDISKIICEALSDVDEEHLTDCIAHIKRLIEDNKNLRSMVKKQNKYLNSCGL